LSQKLDSTLSYGEIPESLTYPSFVLCRDVTDTQIMIASTRLLHAVARKNVQYFAFTFNNVSLVIQPAANHLSVATLSIPAVTLVHNSDQQEI